MASALDKLTAAKNSLTGDQINLTVCKATNHDILSPKRKHVDGECPMKFVVAQTLGREAQPSLAVSVACCCSAPVMVQQSQSLDS